MLHRSRVAVRLVGFERSVPAAQPLHSMIASASIRVGRGRMGCLVAGCSGRGSRSSSSGNGQRQPGQLETIMDLLKYSVEPSVRYINSKATISEAMRLMINMRVGSLVVKDGSDRVIGFLTQRDLLRCIVSRGTWSIDPAEEPRNWNVSVSQIMTLSKDLVYLSPSETLEDARALMAVSGKRHIPVLSGSSLLGVIAPKDIARALHLVRPEVGDQTAKASYVSTVMPRKGVPLGTRAWQAPEEHPRHYALRSAVCNLPHPHKQSVGEDAFLIGPHLIGVADGVGSWWEMDIDPANYARGLMQVSMKSCVAMNAEAELRPQHVLHEAWHTMQHGSIVGSATACLVSLHPHKSELLAANVGDSGFIILRQNEAAENRVGTLDAYANAGSSTSHHVAFRSPQQLRGFNAPFQLGRAPDTAPGESDDRFETPQDAALVRVPIKGGDVLVLATDGLFDNVPESEVLEILEAHSDASEEELAERLAERAKELSLDSTVDSPFATLAKENDILWGGGRPDDITVVVSTVVDTEITPPPPLFKPFCGPGPPLDIELLKAPGRQSTFNGEDIAISHASSFANWD